MRQKTLIKRIKSWTKRSAVVSLAFLFVLANILPAFSYSAYAQAETSASTAENQISPESTTQEGAFFDPGSSSISPTEETNVVDLAAPGTTEKTNINNSDKPKDKTDKNPEEDPVFSATATASDPINDNGASNYNNSKKQDNLPKTDIASGALTYSYPIITPPGRNGMELNLNLNYNSQRKDNQNIIGYGWEIDIPYIERINKNGTEKLYAQNYFNSSLSGELVNTSGGSYRARTDDGSFLSYDLTANVWTVLDKNGTKYTFGKTANSRQDDASDETKVFKWMAEEVRDLNDNYIRYEYFKDQGQIYPSRIVYTGNGVTDGIFSVDFLRESRADSYTSYKAAFQVKTNYRINEIQSKTNGTWNKKYSLSYTTGDNTVRSMLSSIIESGRDESGNAVTLPATGFEYKKGTNGWIKNNSWILPEDTYYEKAIPFVDGNYRNLGVRFVDIDGDGLMDIIKSRINSSTYAGEYAIYKNNGGGWTLSTSWTLPQETLCGWGTFTRPMTFIEYNTADLGVRLSDVNGDGLMDFVKSKFNYISGFGYCVDYGVYINNGSSWSKDSDWSFPNDTYVNRGSGNYAISFVDDLYNDRGVILADVNGDGLADLLKARLRSDGGVDNGVYVNSGSGWQVNTSRFLSNSLETLDH